MLNMEVNMSDAIEKYYIVHYPSNWGMGSSTDESLVTGTNLKRLIANELNRKNHGERHDSRFTGTWNGEEYLESDNMEAIIDDVIQKRLNTCSTYSGLPDLIEIPNDVPVVEMKETMKQKIFRICNQWGFVRDIIVGEAYLTRYRIDLTNYTGNLGLENGKCYEFVEYDLKHVAENHHSEDAQSWLQVEKNRLIRIKGELAGAKSAYEGRYISDIVPEIGTKEWYEKLMVEGQATIDKLTNMSVMEDEYVAHLYSQDYGWFNELMEVQAQRDKTTDYTKMVYRYPLMPDKFACLIEKYVDESPHLIYEELFKKGDNIHHLMAELAGDSETMDGFGDINMFMVLRSVFGYD